METIRTGKDHYDARKAPFEVWAREVAINFWTSRVRQELRRRNIELDALTEIKADEVLAWAQTAASLPMEIVEHLIDLEIMAEAGKLTGRKQKKFEELRDLCRFRLSTEDF